MNLKSRMRQLGLYHEEFSIIYSNNDDEEEEKGRPVRYYKQVDKNEINEVINSGGSSKEMIKEWQLLMVDHEPMQVA